MAFIDQPMLPLCTVRRKTRPGVNTLEMARKLLKNIEGSVERGDDVIMDGKGTPCRMVKKSFVVVRET